MLTVVDDGNEALAYLYWDSPYSGALLPNLVLLDLNLPKVDAIAILQAIKNLRGQGWMISAVFVLSGLADPNQHKAALALGADAIFAKPQDVSGMGALASSIREVWERLSTMESPL